MNGPEIIDSVVSPKAEKERILAIMERMPTPEDEARMMAEAEIVGGEIGQRLDDRLTEQETRENMGRDPRSHFFTNYASEAGHPCKRHLVHARLDCEKRKPMGIDSLYRVQEGNEVEWKAIKALGDVGFKVEAAQVRFDIPWLEVRGRIDGTLPLNRPFEVPGWPPIVGVPVDVKSINPLYWDDVETLEDIRHNRSWWIRGYLSQENFYLFSEGKENPFGYLALWTFGKRPRIIPMARDYDLFRADAHKLLSVNEHVRAGTYPEPIPWDPRVCGLCDWLDMCPVSRVSKLTGIDPGEEPVLRDYLDLKEWHKRYEEAHRALIGSKDKPGRYRGIDAVVGDIEIVTDERQVKCYDIPDDVKAPYQTSRTDIITKIQLIGEGKRRKK